MRRAPFALLVFFFAATAFAGVNESDPGRMGRERAGKHMILHAAALTQADRAELATKGVIVQAPLTGDRYLAIVSDSAVSDARLRSIEPLTSEQKLDRTVYRALSTGKARFDVNVIFHQDVTFDEARAAMLAAGATIDPLRTRFSPTQRITARVASESVGALASDDRVLAIAGSRNWRASVDNQPSAALSHVNLYDRTVEGLELLEVNGATVQYHPEAGPGPRDARHLFDRFLELAA